jgi:hypothetical protein
VSFGPPGRKTAKNVDGQEEHTVENKVSSVDNKENFRNPQEHSNDQREKKHPAEQV